MAALLGLSDHRVVEAWLDGSRVPQPRFRATILTVAGHTTSWRDVPRETLARRTGVHPRTVAAWQRGERALPARYARMIEAHQPGDSLRAWRRKRGFTAAEMAEMIGVHQDTLLGWERTSRVPDPIVHHAMYSVVGEEALWWWPLGELERVKRRAGLDNKEVLALLGCSHARYRSLLRGALPLTERERAILEKGAMILC